MRAFQSLFPLESKGKGKKKKKEKKKHMFPSRQSSRREFPHTQRHISLCIPFRPSTDWMRPTHVRKNNLLPSVYQFLSQFRLEILSQTHPDNICYMCLLTLEINHHNSSKFISHGFDLVTVGSRKMVLSEGIHSTDVLGTILVT